MVAHPGMFLSYVAAIAILVVSIILDYHIAFGNNQCDEIRVPTAATARTGQEADKEEVATPTLCRTCTGSYSIRVV